MESHQNLELVNQAIQKLIEERRNRVASGRSFIEDEDDHLLLGKLLSQLESLKGDEAHQQRDASTEPKEMASAVGETEKGIENACEVDDGIKKVETETEEIVKELKKVKKQNVVTHWLLSVMIVLTLSWQLSEVSLILKVKDGLSHPFRSFGNILTGMLPGQGTEKRRQGENCSVPLKLPELPHGQMSDLVLNCKDA